MWFGFYSSKDMLSVSNFRNGFVSVCPMNVILHEKISFLFLLNWDLMRNPNFYSEIRNGLFLACFTYNVIVNDKL
jgi:hypothetical protein